MTVSIILTSYNYGQYLKDTINSVLNQTCKDWELLVIDDCSTDNSIDIIMEFVNSDDRIRLIRNYENQGLAASLKTGIMAALGDWVAFLESDDLWKKDYLERKLEIAERYADIGFIYNDVEFFDKNADCVQKKFSRLVKRNSLMKCPKNMFYSFGFENPVMTMSSVMVRRGLLEKVDFNTPIDKLLDWFIYIQIAKMTHFYYVNEKLTMWRQHSDSYLTRHNKIKFKFANISAYLLIYRREFWNIKLLLFIILSLFLMCMKRLKVYIFG